MKVASRWRCWHSLMSDKGQKNAALRVDGFGHGLFAVSVAGIGVLSLVFGDLALDWPPVPAWVPWREALADCSGALLLVFGLSLLIDRAAKLSALILTAVFFVWLLLLRIPNVKSLLDEEGWQGVGETAVLVVGAWTLLLMFVGPNRPAFAARLFGRSGLRLSRALFAASLVLLGLSHFAFLKEATSLVPAYFPARGALVVLTGMAHIAAGAAVLMAVVPRLAASMEGIMMALFALIVWAPRVAAAPSNRSDWTNMLFSIAYSAACLIVAAAYQCDRPRQPAEGDALEQSAD